MEAERAPYVVMAVLCSHCKEKQVVHVRDRASFAGEGLHTVECLKCHKGFDVLVPDEIVAGPFAVNIE